MNAVCIQAEEVAILTNRVIQGMGFNDHILVYKMAHLVNEVLEKFDFGLDDVIECHVLLSEYTNFGKDLSNHVYILLNSNNHSFEIEMLETVIAVELEEKILKTFSTSEFIKLSTFEEYTDAWGNLALEKFIQKYVF